MKIEEAPRRARNVRSHAVAFVSAVFGWLHDRFNWIGLLLDLPLTIAAVVLGTALSLGATIAWLEEQPIDTSIYGGLRTSIVVTAIVIVTLALKKAIEMCASYRWMRADQPGTKLGYAMTLGLALVTGSLIWSGGVWEFERLTQIPVSAVTARLTATEAKANLLVDMNQAPMDANELELERYVANAAAEALGPTAAAIYRKKALEVRATYACPIALASLKYGVNDEDIVAVILQESKGDPHAVSPAGARGIMQVMPANAPDANLFDPMQNIDIGTKILGELLQEHDGHLGRALARYNASKRANEAAELKAVAYGESSFWAKLPFMPTETQEYVPSVFGIRLLVANDKPTPTPRKAAPVVRAAKPARHNRVRHHVVKPGETASEIAVRFQVPLGIIQRANNDVRDWNVLKANQVIEIPIS